MIKMALPFTMTVRLFPLMSPPRDRKETATRIFSVWGSLEIVLVQTSWNMRFVKVSLIEIVLMIGKEQGIFLPIRVEIN